MVSLAAPPGSICLRRSPCGGGFRETGRIDPTSLLSKSHHLILFVHGYAVSRSQADDAYGRFLANLDPAWRDIVAAVYWPGDSWQTGQGSHGRRWWDIRPKASYQFMPERAQEGANKLEATLTVALKRRRKTGHSQPLKLYFVAHSMGCRLTLELISRIKTNKQMKLELTVLMAPAVARYKVGRFRGREGLLRPAMLAARQVRVYHSENDGVLFWSFKLGQMLELDFPSGLGDREALGVRGGEDECIINRQFGLGHGQYWSSRDIADDVNAALRVLSPRIFRPGMAPPRLGQKRTVTGRRVVRRRVGSAGTSPSAAQPTRALTRARP